MVGRFYLKGERSKIVKDAEQKLQLYSSIVLHGVLTPTRTEMEPKKTQSEGLHSAGSQVHLMCNAYNILLSIYTIPS